MKKGFAVEGYIQQDGTIRPLEHYDDTELRGKIQTNTDNISNLDSRVTELEEHGGVEDQTKADKVVGATAGNLASLDEEGNLQDSGKQLSGLNDELKNLVRYGVLYSNDGSYINTLYITVIESDRGYVIDTEASGETFSRLSGVKEGIFIPIKVKVENDYHLGYYYKSGIIKTIHLEGLVFEYDTTNNVWLPAQACIVGDQVPHWKKIGETSGFYDMATSTLYTSSEVTAKLYIGMPIRLYGKGSNLNKSYRSRVAGIMSGPTRVKIYASMEDASGEGKFEIYVLSNLDSFFDFDSTPTQYSTKLMTSGAIYEALHALEERVAALEALHAGSVG